MLLWPALLVVGLVMGGVVVVLLAEDEAHVPAVDAEPNSPTGPPSAEVVDTARLSAVLVTASGCPQESVGSGASVEAGVVTNAHVVAGSSEVVVTTSAGESRAATVAVFDPELDLAILHVDGAQIPTLTTAPPSSGTSAVALARDDTGTETEVGVIPLGITRTINIFISDIYGEGRYERRGLELNGDIGPGDSGAAIVDADGQLIGIVFSASRRNGDVAYAVSSAELDRLATGLEPVPVETGDCL